MTKNIWISSMFVAAALSAGSVLADSTGAAPPAPTGAVPALNSAGPGHPCKELREAAIQACTAAKYVKDGHKNHMGLFEDCVKPILRGKGAPANVTVDPGLVSACQAKKAAKK